MPEKTAASSCASRLWPAAPLGILHNLADQRHVGERLPAEEDEVDALAARPFAQEELEGVDRGREGHALPLRGRRQILLVAVGAGEVAARVDVQHQGRERKALHRHRRADRRPLAGRAERAEAEELAQGLDHRRGARTAVEVGPQVVGADHIVRREEVEHVTREGIELEQGAGRDVEEEPPAAGPEIVDYVAGEAEPGAVGAQRIGGSFHRCTVTIRWPSAVSVRSPSCTTACTARSPALFVRNFRCGFGPAAFGTKRPLGSKRPAKAASRAAVAAGLKFVADHRARMGPIRTSSAVPGWPSGPFMYATASSCAGTRAVLPLPPTRAMVKAGSTRTESIRR